MSPSRRLSRLDAEVNRVLAKYDLRKLGSKERKFLADLQQNLSGFRVYTNDYELSETREEQLKNAKTLKNGWSRLAGISLRSQRI
jgi:hypothetical protein